MNIISRPSWGARYPKPRSQQTSASVQEFFIHWPGGEPESWAHVNTTNEERQTMRDIQAFHMGPERGWSDFAYSFGIFRSGRVYRGRGMRYVPAAQLNHNTGTVAAIVFAGPNDSIPDAVEDAIRRLWRHVEQEAGHRVTLRAHRDVTATECPGPKLTAIVNKLK